MATVTKAGTVTVLEPSLFCQTKSLCDSKFTVFIRWSSTCSSFYFPSTTETDNETCRESKAAKKGAGSRSEVREWGRVCVCVRACCAHHAGQGAAIWAVVLACWCINSSMGIGWRRAKAWVTYTQGVALSLGMGAHHGPRRSWLPVTDGGRGRRGGGRGRGGCGDSVGAVLFSPSSSTLEVRHHTCCWYHYCGIVGRRWHRLLAQLC